MVLVFLLLGFVIIILVNLSSYLSALAARLFYANVPMAHGKFWIFFLKFQDLESCGKSLWPWKVLDIKAESPGKITLQVMHFSSGLNGKYRDHMLQISLSANAH